MKRYFILSFFLFVSSLLSFAQMPGFLPSKIFFSPADSQKIFMSIKGVSFFKNNEYFNPIEEGYTLLGFYAEPSIILHLSKDIRMEAGANLLKYSGKNGFYQVQPLFRLQYQPVPWFQMLLGNLYGGSDHGLVEPLYRWERQFTNSVENGLQFLLKTDRINADVWLDWQKFILPNDPYQEELTVGISSEFFLTGKSSDITVSCPVQTLFQHHGGQINSVDLPLETLANWATGLKIHKIYHQCSLRFWETSLYYLGFSDLSPQKLQQYRNGYGIYPKTSIGFGNFTAEVGYFHGTRFESPMGERLFHSATIPASSIAYYDKDLCTGKLLFEKKINTGIVLGAYFGSYIDCSNQKTDYAYGVHISFNRDFFLLNHP
jgi:hypothetical protein